MIRFSEVDTLNLIYTALEEQDQAGESGRPGETGQTHQAEKSTPVVR